VNYTEALAHLDRHINLEKSTALAGRVEGLSLDGMARLVHVLGDPQRAYPVVHVTGTNGKGSTARMIAELLAAHGLVVGLYSSPHLQKVNERLWWSGDARQRVGVDGKVFEDVVSVGKRALPEERDQLVPDEDLIGLDDEEVTNLMSDEVHRDMVENVHGRPGGPIDDETFAAVLSEVADLQPLAGITPSYFELLTAMAFSWFSQIPVDVAVIEVGVLGRYDATNVADAHVAVVTNIGDDHTDRTGDWRADIAREKAGIVKPDSFLVLGEPDAELRPIFADASGGRLWVRGEDFDAEANSLAVGGRVVTVRTPGGVLDELFVPAHGEHQGDNAVLAVAAVEAFFARPLDHETAQAGFWKVRLPGRFEIAGRSPLLVIDGAHNPDGAATVAETLAEDFDVTGKVVYVVGLLRGRDPVQMLDGMGARSAELVIACEPATPRAIPAEEVAGVARGLGVAAEAVADVADAIERARSVTTSDDVIVITGSLYLAGAARTVLGLDPV
jgi:dihydrofolate synthase / folylpolyglutamate synthase